MRTTPIKVDQPLTSPSTESQSDKKLTQASSEIKTNRELELEEIEGKAALAWVADRNNEIKSIFDSSYQFQKTLAETQTILEDKRRIPSVSEHNNYLYNYWRDEKHIQGIWRRTILDEYRKQEPKWETLFDLDNLPNEEHWRELLKDKNAKGSWVVKSITICSASDRAIVGLSLGGKDASISREFDLTNKEFIKNGFQLRESKSSISWCDTNAVFITVDDGKELTKAGYPRFIKYWQRDEALDKARIVFEAKVCDFRIAAHTVQRPEANYHYICRVPTVFQYEYHMLNIDNLSTIILPIPSHAKLETFYRGNVIVNLQKEWKVPNGPTYKEGSIIALELNSIQNLENLQTSLIFEPTSTCFAESVYATENYLLIKILNNISAELYLFELQQEKWIYSSLPLPALGDITGIHTIKKSDNCYMAYENSLTPTTLYYYDRKSYSLEILKRNPELFDASKFQTQQLWATSQDGTKVPYFIVAPKELKLDGKNPTLLYGYGAFNEPILPKYLTNKGPLWLSKGGIFVIANIRGGGELGPKWHQGGSRENRPRSIEDFIAIAEDLIQRKITSPAHLGINGGSAGGILVGASINKRPDLYKAAFASSGVFDMLHFHLMGAGHKSIGEYGDPNDAHMLEILKSFSPYHNISKSKQYPITFFTASTKDDRVVPGHSRKMVDKMKSMGHVTYYYENNEGGHSGAANLKQNAYQNTLLHHFMMIQLFKKNWEAEERIILKTTLMKDNITFFSAEHAGRTFADHVADYVINTCKN